MCFAYNITKEIIMEFFPTEITKHIITYCPLLELNICENVTQSWKEHVGSIPYDYDELVVENNAQFDKVMGVYSVKKIYLDMHGDTPITEAMGKKLTHYIDVAVVSPVIHDTTMHYLAHCETISLSSKLGINAHITDVGYSQLINVKKLDVPCGDIHDISLKYFKNIVSLNVQNCDITNIGLSYLPESCTELNISRCHKITNKGLIHVNQLTWLSIQDTRSISGTGLSHLTQLKTLDISGSSVNDIDVLDISKTCTEFSCRGCENITNIGLNQLTQITKLNISKTKLTNEAVTCMSGLVNLDIVGCDNIGDDILTKIPTCKTLHTSSFKYKNANNVHKLVVWGGGTERMAPPYMENLKKIILYACTMLIDAHFSSFSAVETVHLSDLDTITDAGVLKLISCKKIHLFCCDLITNEGIIGLPNCTNISAIGCSGFTDGIFQHLTQYKRREFVDCENMTKRPKTMHVF